MVKRVLTYLKPSSSSTLYLAKFRHCAVDALLGHSGDSNEVFVNCQLDQGKLIVSTATEHDPNRCLLRHPPFCPIRMCAEKKITLPDLENEEDGVRVGIVALVETADQHLLVTRRAKHMRTFPGVWVPPGGGAEVGESLTQTALRELLEETGLNIEGDINSHHILCLWESVYPPFLDLGHPKRRHIVIYFHFLLKKNHNLLNKDIVLDPNEVDASAWLSKEQVDLVVNGVKDGSSVGTTFPIKVLADDGEVMDAECPTRVLLAKAPTQGDDVSRMSTGTRFALSEWLKYCSSLCKNSKL